MPGSPAPPGSETDADSDSETETETETETSTATESLMPLLAGKRLLLCKSHLTASA